MFILLQHEISFHEGETSFAANSKPSSRGKERQVMKKKFFLRDAGFGWYYSGDHMPYSHVHRIISIEKFKIPLLIPPAGAPALIWSQISRLFCIFNIHLQTPNMPFFPMIPSIHCLVSLLISPSNTNNEREACKAIFLVKNLVFLYVVSFPSETRREQEWA